jgi:hypothetical protein
MNVKRLYHGTISLFENVEVLLGKGYKDFGKGFYTTEDKEHAERLALRNKYIELDKLNMQGVKGQKVSAYLYEYDFDMDLIKKYNSKVFDRDADLEWVKFVLANRTCRTKSHDFDIVIGATADDDTKTTLKAYFAGLYGEPDSEGALEMLIKFLETDKLSRQIYFGTQQAADHLVSIKRSMLA